MECVSVQGEGEGKRVRVREEGRRKECINLYIYQASEGERKRARGTRDLHKTYGLPTDSKYKYTGRYTRKIAY